MSKEEKLRTRFSSFPNDFTWDELKRLLEGFGYRLSNSGKTSGARAAFINDATGDSIRLHRPHPGNVVKTPYLKMIRKHLEEEGSL